VQFTFSEDFGVVDDPSRQEVFKIGKIIAQWSNEYTSINNFSRDKAFIGLTTAYFKEVTFGVGRLGVIYNKCSSWKPPASNPLPGDASLDEKTAANKSLTNSTIAVIAPVETQNLNKTVENAVNDTQTSKLNITVT